MSDSKEVPNDVDGASCPSRCSIAPHVLPFASVPQEAVDFAQAVGQLCDQYGIRDLSMDIRVDRFTREHEYREDIVSDMKITVSTMDGRGRPRKRIHINAAINVAVPIVWEKDSTN